MNSRVSVGLVFLLAACGSNRAQVFPEFDGSLSAFTLEASVDQVQHCASPPCLDWSTAALPVATSEHFVGMIGSAIFVAGGGNFDLNQRGPTSSTIYGADLQSAPLTPRFSTQGGLSSPLIAGTALGVGDSIFVFGGVTVGGANLSVLRGTLTQGALSFASVAQFPAETIAPAAAGFRAQDGERIVLVGGASDSAVLATTYIWNPATSTISDGPALPQARGYASAVTIDNHVYVVGGIGASNRNVTSVLRSRHDATQALVGWDQVAAFDGGYGASLFVLGDYVWYVGGLRNMTISREVLRAPIVDGEVRLPFVVAGGPLPSAVASAATVVANGKVCILGGRGRARYHSTDAVQVGGIRP